MSGVGEVTDTRREDEPPKKGEVSKLDKGTLLSEGVLCVLPPRRG